VKGIWDLIMFICIIFQAIVIPFKLCFDVESTPALFTYFDSTIDVFFILDIFLCFNTGFYQNGFLNLNRCQIVIQYLKTWFTIDLLASFPYTYILDTDSTTSNRGSIAAKTPQLLRLLKIFRFLRFLKLLRVLKIQKITAKYEDFIFNDRVNMFFSFFKLINIIFFFAHCLACLFYGVSQTTLYSTPDSWIKVAGIEDESTLTKYIDSLYWAFTTMITVGYGDISPRNTIERLFTMFAMIVSAGVYAFTINSIGKMVSEFNMLAAQFRENMFFVNQFMVQNKLPKHMRIKVRRYLEYQWEQKKLLKIEQDDVLSLLNQDLNDKIVLYMYGRYFQTLSFSDDLGVEFVGHISFFLKTDSYAIDDDIFFVSLSK